ncbi:hypothetical protein [Neobacillus drentensis]|uniref:hypothetical protein n=1 Tax=Neobacillus drentensis TaxID=220684 RepID=UPI0030002AD6
MAELKVIVDFITMLIGAEGAKTPAGVRGRGGSPQRPRKAKRLKRKSTCNFNTA